MMLSTPVAYSDNLDAISSDLLPLSDALENRAIVSLAPDCYGGVILQKSFYADFVGPGAAIGGNFDVNSVPVYVIGSIKVLQPLTHRERQQAFQQRVSYIAQLHYIASTPSPLRRAALMVSQLCDWVGIHEASEIPMEWVAKLAGVQPKTVELAWQKYWQDCQMFMKAN